jgi:hypothetical protein
MTVWPLPLAVGGLAVLGAATAVVLLYLLKPPPSTVVVPSNLIWDRVLRESHPTAQRLRWWLSLLLALLIVTAVTSAVVGLRRADAIAGSAASKLIVVLDNSPTMATRTTDGSTRLARALVKARALMNERAPDSQIWLSDTMRLVAIPAFRNRTEALAQLAQLHVAHADRPTIALPAKSSHIETVIITDGVSIGSLPAHARVESVFESVENAGITAFELRALPADPHRYMAYVELVNASGIDKQIELAISGLGGKRISRMVPVNAGGTRHELIDVSDFGSGPVRASITMPGDGLAADDIAYAILPARRVMRVALVTNHNPFLEKSLQTQPRVQLTTVTPARYVDARTYDAVVFDRFAPKRRPMVPAILFSPPPVDWLPPLAEEAANLSVVAWNATHPLLENTSLADLSVKQARVFILKGRNGAESVIANAPGGVPLIVAREESSRWISVAFALEASNFALQASFPIFMNNALNWLVRERAYLARGLGTIEIPVADAHVVAADGTAVPTQAIAGGSLFEADAPGLFTAVSAHQRLRIAVNLFERRTTEVNKSALAQSRPSPADPTGVHLVSGIDASFVLLLGAALLLLFEWWSWNRRMTV